MLSHLHAQHGVDGQQRPEEGREVGTPAVLEETAWPQRGGQGLEGGQQPQPHGMQRPLLAAQHAALGAVGPRAALHRQTAVLMSEFV